MYQSHPSYDAYGNPGFFVDNPSGSVRDSSGRSVSLRPDMSQRNTRRILIRTSDLPKNSDGTYTAKIRKAHNVSAIKLSYASIPRSVSRVTAQLILYSVHIKRNLGATEHQKLALQRLARNQLLSHDSSDFPFFRISQHDFDWRNGAMSTWINSFDKNTQVPPQLESDVSNQYVDIDVLTVNVPSMCSLHMLGEAFSSALKSHSGAKNSKNNSIWKDFDISVEQTGFSVFENINDSEVLTTFASFLSPEMLAHNTVSNTHTQSARNTFVPMGTPLTITLNKSKSVFVSANTLDGATTAPAEVSTSTSIMTEFPASPSEDGDDTFKCIVNTPNRLVYSFSCYNDVSVDDILEVKYKQIVEISVLSVPPATTTSNPEFNVTYYYGTSTEAQSGTSLSINSGSTPTGVTLGASDYSITESTVQINGTWNSQTNTLTLSSGSVVIEIGTSFFVQVGADKVVNISEVKRTYQKHRDVRLGLRWGDNEENRDFFIDCNHSFDSPLITNSPLLHQNYEYSNLHRRDVALLSQFSKAVTAYTALSTNGFGSNIEVLQPSGTIFSGMILIKSNKFTASDDNASIVVQSVNGNQVALSQSVDVAQNVQLSFRVPVAQDDGYYNMLRNTGDLQDTYIQPTPGMSELYNVHEMNDSHQLQRMLFNGHMMNVEEPSPMPMSSDATLPDHASGRRPRTDTQPSIPVAAAEFYQHGLGWETAVVHEPTRFVMSAFPVRFTEINDDENTSDPHSIYNIDDVTSANTSVSPLVSRILSVAKIDENNLGYYKLTKLSDDGTVDDTFDESNGTINTDSSNGIRNLSFYEPRQENNCGIVVLIGNQNFVVKSARIVSLLRNKTEFTLNLTCDRNYNNEPTFLSSITNLERVKNKLLNKGNLSQTEQQTLASVQEAASSAFHSFYRKIDTGYELNSNAKYFAWVFELDRPVNLRTGVTTGNRGTSDYNPPVTNRSFTGIADPTAMFSPGVFERTTGRSAVTTAQQSAHNFFVRSGSRETEHSLLLLHGIGSLERPINSSANLLPADVFAVMASEYDLNKEEKIACESTTYLNSPQNLDRFDFSFMNSRNGQQIEIGNQNATLIFDLYCSNE